MATLTPQATVVMAETALLVSTPSQPDWGAAGLTYMPSVPFALGLGMACPVCACCSVLWVVSTPVTTSTAGTRTHRTFVLVCGELLGRHGPHGDADSCSVSVRRRVLSSLLQRTSCRAHGEGAPRERRATVGLGPSRCR